MRAPVVIGWVLMGFRIDQSRADEMRQLLSVHVALMVKAPGGAMTLPVSTLPADAQALLLASGGAAGELQTAEGTLLARSSPLDSVGGEVHSLLLRSVDELAADHRVGDETWKRLAEDFDRRQLMDLVFTIGAYDLLAVAMNTFGLQLDPGLTGFPEEGES